MKFRFLFLAAALALPFAAKAQTNKSYVGVQAGVSAPVGDFGKADYYNNKAGFARTSFHAAVDGTYFIGSSLFGLSGQLGFSDNGRASGADLDRLGAGYTDGFAVDESTVSLKGRYQRLTAMVGPTLAFPVGKLTLEARGLVGLVKSLSTPEYTVQLEDNSALLLVQKSSHKTAFGYQLGAALRYAFTDRVGLVLRSDYLYSDGVKIDNQNRNNNAGRLVTKQPIAAINSSIGLTFAFGE